MVAKGWKRQAGLGLVCFCGGPAVLGSRSQGVTGAGVAVTGQEWRQDSYGLHRGHRVVTGSFLVSQSPGASLGGAVTEELETV